MPYANPQSEEVKAKRRETCKRYRDAHKEKEAAYQREYYRKHKEQVLRRTNAWRKRNQAKVNAAQVVRRRADPDKTRQYQREWRAKNKGRRASQERAYAMKRNLAKFGCTLEQRDEMLQTQEYKCALCAGPFSAKDYPVVDHCHTRNKVRAVLHNRCNLALGLLDDDPVKANQLFEYLMTHQ